MTSGKKISLSTRRKHVNTHRKTLAHMSGLDQYMNQTPASDWSLLGFLKSRAMQSDFTGRKDKEHYRYQMSLKAVQLLDEFTAAEKENAKLCLDNLKVRLVGMKSITFALEDGGFLRGFMLYSHNTGGGFMLMLALYARCGPANYIKRLYAIFPQHAWLCACLV